MYKMDVVSYELWEEGAVLFKGIEGDLYAPVLVLQRDRSRDGDVRYERRIR